MRLSHFRIGLICTLAAVNPKYRDLCVASMRDLVVEEVDFNEKAQSDAWIKNAMAALSPPSSPPTAAASGDGLHAVKCVFDILNISSNSSASETIISSIVDLAFMLIDTVKKDSGGVCFGRGKPAAAATTAEAGRALLKRIFDGVGSDEGTLESIRKSIIKKVRTGETRGA